MNMIIKPNVHFKVSSCSLSTEENQIGKIEGCFFLIVAGRA